nr:hypothetical protein [Rhizobium sp. ACO-34A]
MDKVVRGIAVLLCIECETHRCPRRRANTRTFGSSRGSGLVLKPFRTKAFWQVRLSVEVSKSYVTPRAFEKILLVTKQILIALDDGGDGSTQALPSIDRPPRRLAMDHCASRNAFNMRWCCLRPVHRVAIGKAAFLTALDFREMS